MTPRQWAAHVVLAIALGAVVGTVLIGLASMTPPLPY